MPPVAVQLKQARSKFRMFPMPLETHGAFSQLCIFVQSMICLDNFFTLRACSLIRFMLLLFTLDNDRVDHYWYCYYLLCVASDTYTYKALFKMDANVSMAWSGRGSVGGGGWMGTSGPPPRGIKCQGQGRKMAKVHIWKW